MGAQPGQFGQPGGMAPQQAGMQAQGMGAPGEAARSVSRISGMGSQIFNMQHAGRTLLRCSDMLQSACHPCKLCRQQTVAAGQTCARPSHNRATNRQHHEQNISQNLHACRCGRQCSDAAVQAAADHSDEPAAGLLPSWQPAVQQGTSKCFQGGFQVSCSWRRHLLLLFCVWVIMWAQVLGTASNISRRFTP